MAIQLHWGYLALWLRTAFCTICPTAFAERHTLGASRHGNRSALRAKHGLLDMVYRAGCGVCAGHRGGESNAVVARQTSGNRGQHLCRPLYYPPYGAQDIHPHLTRGRCLQWISALHRGGFGTGMVRQATVGQDSRSQNEVKLQMKENLICKYTGQERKTKR